MNFFKKVKVNYYSKLLPNLILQKKTNDIKNLLTEINSIDIRQSLLIFRKYFNELALFPKDSIFNNDLIWITSFLKSDCKIITKFLNYYFSELKINQNNFTDYEKYISQINFLLGLQDANFDQIVNDSYFYQHNLQIKNIPGDLNFISNQIPFFETYNQLMFSHPIFTKCYFYIIRNPLEILSILKNESQDENQNLNSLLNLDHRPTSLEFEETANIVQIYRKDWATHVKSWTSQNVLENFNGLIINLLDFKKDPMSVFADIIGHLIQSGMKIPLDYNLIENYISKFLVDTNEIAKIELSNQKKKLLKDIDETAAAWGYNLNL